MSGSATPPAVSTSTLVWLSINGSHSHASWALPCLHAACAELSPTLDWIEVECPPDGPSASQLAHLVSWRPAVLAATCYLFNVAAVLRVCRRVKALLPDLYIVLGGPEFLGVNRAFLEREGAVDAVVRGDGEGVLPELLSRVLAGASVNGLPGVSARDAATGRVHEAPDSAPELPFAHLKSPVEDRFFRLDKPFVQLESSRGCLATCAFCTSAGHPLRNGDPERLASELAHLRACGVRTVRMLDRTFNASPGRCVRTLAIFRETFPDLRFHLEMHPGLLPAAVRAAIARAPEGQLHIEAGFQTSHAGALGHAGRLGSGEETWDGLRFLAGCGNLDLHVDLLAGLPGQTPESLAADLQRLVQLGPAEIQLETVKVLPGTVLAENAGAWGVRHAPDPPYEVLATRTMTAADLAVAERLSRLTDRFYNPVQTRAAVRCGVDEQGIAFLYGLAQAAERHAPDGLPMSLARRMKLLHAQAAAAGLGGAAQRVEYAWLRHGMSPQHGIVEAELWKEPLPEPGKAILLEGEIPDYPARIWQAVIGGRNLLFVYDRRRTAQPAVAVLQLPD